ADPDPAQEYRRINQKVPISRDLRFASRARARQWVPVGPILPLGFFLFRRWGRGGNLRNFFVREVFQIQLRRLFGGLAFELFRVAGPELFFRPRRHQAARCRTPGRRRARSLRRRGGGPLRSRTLAFRSCPGAGSSLRFARPFRSGFPGPYRLARSGFPGPYRLARSGFPSLARLARFRALPGRRAPARRSPTLRATARAPALSPANGGPGGFPRASASPFFRFFRHLNLPLRTAPAGVRIIQFRVCRGESSPARRVGRERGTRTESPDRA